MLQENRNKNKQILGVCIINVGHILYAWYIINAKGKF